MELSLQSYFDIGETYGLGDKAFEVAEGVTVPDILGIGISNPLGRGIVCRVDQTNPEVVDLWRHQAVAKVDAPEMELGYDGPIPTDPGTRAHFEEFKNRLRRLIASHPISRCEMTIYGLGVVFVRLDFSIGIPLSLAVGLIRCFEYAGYYIEVSENLLNLARRTAEKPRRRSSKRRWPPERGLALQRLSKRPDPEVQTDAKGYKESRLFSAFTRIAMCVDEGDDIDAIKRRLLPNGNSIPLKFEFHGTIHFDWGDCVIEPRSYDDLEEPPRTQIRRMLMCILIAHTFQGAREAFQNLFLHATFDQAEGFIRGQPSGLSHIELSRLRTLALAVTSMTRFETVTQTAEDQAYFEAYDKQARLDRLQENILRGSEVIFNVEKAEADREQERRVDNLNTSVIFLTGIAVLSALWDIYEFIRGGGEQLEESILRMGTLMAVLLLLLLLLIGINRKVRVRRQTRYRRA